MRILLIAPNWLGDLIISQSLIKALKLQYPNCQIDLSARSSISPIAKRMKELNQVIPVNTQSGKFSFFAQLKLAKKIKNRYDWAIILPITFKSALPVWLSRIKKRTGFLGESRYFLINDIIYSEHKPNNKQNLTQQAIYLNLIGIELSKLSSEKKIEITPRLEINLKNKPKIIAKFALHTPKKIIAFAMGSNYGKSKQWPIEFFQELALKLTQQNYLILLLGAKKEKTLSEIFFNQQKLKQLDGESMVDLIGKTSLTETLDLLSICKTLVTNDSGLMHLAASIGSEIIVIYGSTTPKFTPPLTLKENKIALFQSNLACSPCFARTCRFGHYNCLKQTRVPQVIAAINQLTPLNAKKI